MEKNFHISPRLSLSFPTAAALGTYSLATFCGGIELGTWTVVGKLNLGDSLQPASPDKGYRCDNTVICLGFLCVSRLRNAVPVHLVVVARDHLAL